MLLAHISPEELFPGSLLKYPAKVPPDGVAVIFCWHILYGIITFFIGQVC
jgi:hypothetical protein